MSISVLIGILGALVAGYFHSKLKTSQALVENHEATKALDAVDSNLAKNQGLLEAEELKRKNNEVPDVSKEQLLDFVNKRLPPT